MRQIICNDSSVDNGRPSDDAAGPDQVLVNVDIRSRLGLDVQELELAIDRIEKSIRQKEPTLGRIIVEVDSLRSAWKSQAEAKR
jgi:divalent metal cation (Fe/Co/Zn/Cd) transporter